MCFFTISRYQRGHRLPCETNYRKVKVIRDLLPAPKKTPKRHSTPPREFVAVVSDYQQNDWRRLSWPRTEREATRRQSYTWKTVVYLLWRTSPSQCASRLLAILRRPPAQVVVFRREKKAGVDCVD